MRPKEENVIDKMQPEAGFLERGMKEILFKDFLSLSNISNFCLIDFSITHVPLANITTSLIIVMYCFNLVVLACS